MKTQQEIIKIYKESKGQIHVFSFDNNGRRSSTYGALDLVTAFEEIAARLNEGKRIILVDKFGYDALLTKEIKEKRRVTYDEAKAYSTLFNKLMR